MTEEFCEAMMPASRSLVERAKMAATGFCNNEKCACAGLAGALDTCPSVVIPEVLRELEDRKLGLATREQIAEQLKPWFNEAMEARALAAEAKNAELQAENFKQDQLYRDVCVERESLRQPLTDARTIIEALGVVEQDGILVAYRHGATGTTVSAFRRLGWGEK